MKMAFSFNTDLFETRSNVQDWLSAADLEMMDAYGSIDLLHDLNGVEVCEIPTQRLAETVALVVTRQYRFPFIHVCTDDDKFKVKFFHKKE
jgi:hypothetical protein